MSEHINNNKWHTALLALFLFSFAPPAVSEEFAGQVWTYDEYKRQHSEQSEVIRRFERTVQHAAPPRLDRSGADPVHISVIYPGKQVSDYWRRSIAAFTARLDQAGLPYHVESLFTEAGTEIRQQERFIARALRSNPDYMVFTLDALHHKTIVERMIGGGRTKVILQNITTPVRDWRDYQPFLYVGFDHAVGAKLLAKRYIAETGGQGDYAIFYGPNGYVSEMRGDTFLRYVTENSDLRLQASYYVGFNREKAKAAALTLLSEKPDLKFIYACSTDIAHGITDALQEKGLLGQVMVNGWGGGSSELDAVNAIELNFTVMRINDDNGVAMADAVILDQSNRTDEVPTVYSGDMVVVDQTTDSATLNALTRRAFRYSK